MRDIDQKRTIRRGRSRLGRLRRGRGDTSKEGRGGYNESGHEPMAS